MPSTGIKLRDDFDAPTLRQLSKRCDDTRQVRRLLALAAIYGGMNRADAARAGGMDRQTLRDWMNMLPTVASLVGDVGSIRGARHRDYFALEWHPSRFREETRKDQGSDGLVDNASSRRRRNGN